MKLNRNRWTIAVVAVWALALVLTTFLAPAPAQAEVSGIRGWMTYAPNHPNGCVPLPYDCYFLEILVPND